MRTLLRNLARAARRWSGTGAVHNARLEVDRASRSVVELERQLERVFEPPPRRAA
jgi:hypothetical protein